MSITETKETDQGKVATANRKGVRVRRVAVTLLVVAGAMLAFWFLSPNKDIINDIKSWPLRLAHPENPSTITVSVTPDSQQYIQVVFKPDDGAIERGLLSGRGTVKNVSPATIPFLVLDFSIGDGQLYVVDPQVFRRVAPGEEREFNIIPMRITGSPDIVFGIYR